ncbi:MAG: ferritin family protein [Candidatus Aminicenantia bacterium]
MGKNIILEAINYAIQREEKAVQFYQQALSLTLNQSLKEMFRSLADEEKKHKELLQKIKQKDIIQLETDYIPDLKITDYLIPVEFSPEMDLQELLILAIKKEEESITLYTQLAERSKNSELIKLFQLLIQQEKKHKFKLEAQYEDFIYQED